MKNPQDSVVIATTEGKICFFVTKVVIGAFLGAIRVVSGWRVLDTNQTTRSRERIQYKLVRNSEPGCVKFLIARPYIWSEFFESCSHGLEFKRTFHCGN